MVETLPKIQFDDLYEKNESHICMYAGINGNQNLNLFRSPSFSVRNKNFEFTFLYPLLKVFKRSDLLMTFFSGPNQGKEKHT